MRSSRETTQPNQADTEYWATGLTPVYLEGALRRTLQGPPRPARIAAPPPSIFSEPAPSLAARDVEAHGVLDPFAVYHKDEALLRKQLGALSAWHLVNIALEHELTNLDVVTLNHMPAAALAELIVTAVREQSESQAAGKLSRP